MREPANLFRPTDRSWDLVRAYGRYLSRTYGATSVEIIRHTRDPIPPEMLLSPGNMEERWPEELIANYGEVNEP